MSNHRHNEDGNKISKLKSQNPIHFVGFSNNIRTFHIPYQINIGNVSLIRYI